MNFILRRVTELGHVSNQIIGKEYHLIFNCKPDEKGFDVLLQKFSSINHGHIHAFVIFNGGREWTPLYKVSTYYIMTENGKTFDTIKYYGVGRVQHKGTGRVENEKDIAKAQLEIDKFKNQ